MFPSSLLQIGNKKHNNILYYWGRVGNQAGNYSNHCCWIQFYITFTFIIRKTCHIYVNNLWEVTNRIYLEPGSTFIMFSYQVRRTGKWIPGNSAAFNTPPPLLHCPPCISHPRQEIFGEEQRNKGTDVNPLHQVKLLNSRELNRQCFIKSLIQICPAGEFCPPPLLSGCLAPHPPHFATARGNNDKVKISNFLFQHWRCLLQIFCCHSNLHPEYRWVLMKQIVRNESSGWFQRSLKPKNNPEL